MQIMSFRVPAACGLLLFAGCLPGPGFRTAGALKPSETQIAVALSGRWEWDQSYWGKAPTYDDQQFRPALDLSVTRGIVEDLDLGAGLYVGLVPSGPEPSRVLPLGGSLQARWQFLEIGESTRIQIALTPSASAYWMRWLIYVDDGGSTGATAYRDVRMFRIEVPLILSLVANERGDQFVFGFGLGYADGRATAPSWEPRKGEGCMQVGAGQFQCSRPPRGFHGFTMTPSVGVQVRIWRGLTVFPEIGLTFMDQDSSSGSLLREYALTERSWIRGGVSVRYEL